MAPLAGGPPLEDVVKQVRAAYKRSQREFRARRNSERVRQLEGQLEERVRQMKERRAAQEAEKAAAPGAEAAAAASGRKR
jgi:hypothetical protein